MIKYKKIRERVLSLALTLAMVCTMLPATAFAVEGSVSGAGTGLKITSFDELAEPLVKSKDADNVYELEIDLKGTNRGYSLPDTLKVTVERTVVQPKANVSALSVGSAGGLVGVPITSPANANLAVSDIDSTHVLEGGNISTPTNATASDIGGADSLRGRNIATSADAVNPSPDPQENPGVVTITEKKTIAVTWADDRSSNSDASKFIFNAVLPDGYTLADGVKVPQIHLSIKNFDKKDVVKDAVTSTIDFTTKKSSDDKLTTEGWKWDYKAGGSTLTLKGLNVATDSGSGIVVPVNTKIVISKDSNNSIRSRDDSGISVRGNEKDGYLSIEGEGTLEVSGLTGGIDGFKEYGSKELSLSIEKSEVIASGYQGPGIEVNGDFKVSKGALVRSFTNDQSQYAFGIYNRKGSYSVTDDTSELIGIGEAGGISSDAPLAFAMKTMITGADTPGKAFVLAAVGNEKDGTGKSRNIYLGSDGKGALAKEVRVTAGSTIAAITIDTKAPFAGYKIDNGVNAVPTGVSGLQVTWLDDTGKQLTSAEDEFKEGITYKTKYTYSADAGYVFGAGVTVTNLGDGKVDVEITNDTLLTVTVTWPKTKSAKKRTQVLDLTKNSVPKESNTQASWGNPQTSNINALDEENWQWEYNPKGSTLKLNGVYFTEKKGTALLIPGNTTIELVEGSVNRVEGKEKKSIGLQVNSNGEEYCKIIGAGTLKLSGDSYGFKLLGNNDKSSITIDEKAVVEATSKGGYAINLQKGSLYIKGGAMVTAVDESSKGVGLQVDDGKLIMEGAGTELFAIGGDNSISVKNGFDSPDAVITASAAIGGTLSKAAFGDKNGINRGVVYTKPDENDTQYWAKRSKIVITKDISTATIGTTAPSESATIVDGLNNVAVGAMSPTITWSSDGGSTWQPANGNFAGGTVYKTKYTFRTNKGYVFKKGIKSTDIQVTNLGGGSVNVTSEDGDKTLTVVVTWPKTAGTPSVTHNEGTGAGSSSENSIAGNGSGSGTGGNAGNGSGSITEGNAGNNSGSITEGNAGNGSGSITGGSSSTSSVRDQGSRSGGRSGRSGGRSSRSGGGGGGGSRSGGGSGGGGGGGSRGTAGSVPASKPAEKVVGTVNTTVAVDNGNAAVAVSSQTISDALKAAQDAAGTRGVSADEVSVVINVTTGGTAANTVSVNLPKAVQDQLSSNKVSDVAIYIDNPGVSIGMDLAAIQEISRQANADVQFTANRLNAASLSAEAQQVIGGRPVFDLKATFEQGAKSVTNFGSGSVNVAIPYTLQSGEMPGGLFGIYVDGSGQVSYITNSSYDTESKMLRYSTNHLSVYGIGYRAPINLTDITNHWAKNSIDFAVNRGLINGAPNAPFSPDAAMTRAEFVTALGRLAGIDVNSHRDGRFTDVDPGAYYAPYVNWAAGNGIISGTSETALSPDQAVSRQEMAAMMSNYAKAMGHKVPKIRTAVTFADSGEIEGWASLGVKQMQMAGILSVRNDNKFEPASAATRGETAAMIQRYVAVVLNKSSVG